MQTKPLSNDELLVKYASLVPEQDGTSPVIHAQSGESPNGLWTLLIRFVKKTVSVNHPTKGRIQQANIVVERAMTNSTKEVLADLPDVGETLPPTTGLFRDFVFVAYNEATPQSDNILQSGYQPFTNANGMGSFDSGGRLLMVNEFIAVSGTEGKVHPFPTTERLTPIRPSTDSRLSKREALFAAYRDAFSTAVAPVHF